MSDRPLQQPFEATGTWHLPDSPDRVITGDLRYTVNGTELDLHEPFYVRRGVISTSDERPRYPLIHGTTREGEAMTLLNAQSAGWSFNFSSGGFRESERVFSVWLLVGAHVPANFTYPKVGFRIPGLQVWLSRKVIEETLERDEATHESSVSYRVRGFREEKLRVPSIETTFGWGTSRHFNADAFTSIDVTVSGWLTIEPDSPKPLEWFIDQESKATTMLAFLAGTSMSPDLIEASIDASTHRVSVMVTLRDAKYCSYKNLHDFFMPRGSMTVDLGTVLNNWFEVYEKVDKPSQLALSVFGSEKLWLHVEFLSLVQALEGFHRGLFEGKYMPDEDYEPIKDTLGKAIPSGLADDHKAALRARFRYGNQFSLRKRLDALAGRLSPALRAMIFGANGGVPGQWVDTRNFYSHWDESLSSKILDGQGMYYANVRMRHFLRALYLDLMRIPQEAILASLRNASDSSQHLIQLNAAERRAADPSDMSGAYMRIQEQKREAGSEATPETSADEPSQPTPDDEDTGG